MNKTKKKYGFNISSRYLKYFTAYARFFSLLKLIKISEKKGNTCPHHCKGNASMQILRCAAIAQTTVALVAFAEGSSSSPRIPLERSRTHVSCKRRICIHSQPLLRTVALQLLCYRSPYSSNRPWLCLSSFECMNALCRNNSSINPITIRIKLF